MKLTDREHDLIDQLGIEFYKLKKEMDKISPKSIADKFEVSEQYIYRRWEKYNDSGKTDAINP